MNDLINFSLTPSDSAATMSLKLIFIKLILPGDPRVDLDAVEPTVDAVDTATSSILLLFSAVVTLRSTSLVGSDSL